MVTASLSPVSSVSSDDVCDRNARTYLLALKAGKKPDMRPDCGVFWSALVEQAERMYAKVAGNKEAMERWFETLEKTTPALGDLLAPPSSLSAHELGIPPLPETARLPAELSKGACPELDLYEEYSKRASPEAYDHFHVFCGLWGFSAVAARRVCLELADHRFYTNLMVVLTARTTLVAKTETAKIAKKMLYHAGLEHLLLGDRITPQKLLSDMAGVHVPVSYAELPEEKQEWIRQRLAMPGQRAWHYDEFGKFVQSMLRRGSSMADFAELFLQLDQCPPHYSNATIARDMEPIERPYLSLIGTMTPANIRESARAGGEFWGDGFWARFAFITPPSDFFKTQTWGMGKLVFPQDLVTSLQRWHARLGVPECRIVPLYDKKGEPSGRYTIERDSLPEHACTISPEAWKAFDQYRIALRTMMATRSHPQDLDGNYGRLPDMALRMAVIMASLSNNNRIEMRHWAKAQELAEILRANLHELYRQVNADQQGSISREATIEEEILKHLSNHGPMTLASLRFSYLKRRSVKEIEEGLRSLLRAKAIEEFPTSHSKKYRLRALESAG